MARKNGNGEGSRPRERTDGRWEARYWVGGKRYSVYESTRKEAAERLARAKANSEEPRPTSATTNNITVREFFAQYDAGYVYHGTISNLMKVCVSEAMPESPEAAGKAIRRIAKRTPRLTVESTPIGKERGLKITLEKTVGTVQPSEDHERGVRR